METRLTQSLHHKLGDLDHKVRAYRHDLLADFRRYYDDQLRDVNPAIASNVGRAIALSLSNYQALRPDLDEFIRHQPAESRDPSNPGSASFQPSPPSSVFGAAEAQTDLRERERELQGLFTPSYLPLLESLPIPAKLSPAAAYPALPAVATPSIPLLPEPGLAGTAQGGDMNRQRDTADAQGGSLSDALPQELDRPGHVRRSTDDTSLSIVSDKSDTKVRRKSALRHSSSPAKIPASPRRVRFEFEGAEVLPTSSPEPSESSFPPASSAQIKHEQLASHHSILDDEDEDARLPPPRKISSSEALRALSRTPLEEGTVWTVVDPNSDKPSQAQPEMVPPTSTSPIANETVLPTPTSRGPLASAVEFETVKSGTPLSSVHEEPDQERDSDNDSSGDEFLAMAKTRKSPTSPVPKSPTRTAAALSPRPNENSHRRLSLQTNSQSSMDDVDVDDEGDLFQFEHGGGLSAPPRPRPITPPNKEEDVEDEPVVTTDAPPSANTESTAVTITQPASPRGPPTPTTTTRFQTGSIGSYKGRPVIMPVVRNPEVHAQAASLGQFNTFVGGLDGRSGMDEGDLNSFRASLVQSGFSGTPRSLTERLMMEEAMERRQDRARPQ